MKIITLVENLVYSTGLSAEHGLSFYIDTGFHKIIFDTGQSDIFLKNAEKLSIDINDVDYVVISHGHYDHTGGLYHFLNNNSKSKIIAKKEIFVPKYSRNSKYIGTEYKQELIENRIEYVDNVMQLDDFIYVIPNINIYESIDTNFAHFQVKKVIHYCPIYLKMNYLLF